MANKTQPTHEDVAAFIATVPDPVRRAEAETVITMFAGIAGESPKLWGPSIVGFGTHHYRYATGREGDMPRIAFAPRKPQIVFYGLGVLFDRTDLFAALGKHSTGKGCLYVKRLSDIDLGVLEALARLGWSAKREADGC